MIQRRLLLWCTPLLALLAAGAWWIQRTPAPSAVVAPPPAVVMPPGAATPANHTADIDALWERYAALSQAPAPSSSHEDEASAPSTAGTLHEPALSPAHSPELSEAARQRQAARDRIQQRRAAILMARDEALARIDSLDPSDVDGLVATIQRFNTRLNDQGVEERIDLSGLRHRLEHGQRLAEVNQALLDEALKGEHADPQRLRALSREMRNLQSTLLGGDSPPAGSGTESP